MKKRVLFILALFSIMLLIMSLLMITIKAQPEAGLPSETQGIEKLGEKISEGGLENLDSSQYLKKEWGKILETWPVVGPIIRAYEKIAPVTDPVFKYTIGMSPSLSWLFILTLVLWIAFVIYIFRVLELASIFSNQAVKIIISIGLVIVLSITGLTKKLAEYIINAISLLDVWWMQLITALLVIIAIILASVFSKALEDYVKNLKEYKEKAKEESNRRVLEETAKILNKD